MTSNGAVDADWWRQFYSEDYLSLVADLATPGRTRAEIDFLVRRLRIDRQSKIVDIGCGTGRHTIALAKRNFDCIGIDINETFLALARAEAAGLAGATFRICDMRSLLPGRFSHALCMYNSFGFFSDRENADALANWTAALLPRGCLVLDLWNRARLDYSFSPVRARLLSSGGSVTEYSSYDPNRGLLRKSFVFSNGNSLRNYQAQFRVFSVQEIKDMLTEAGADFVETFGDLYGAPYSPTSERMVVIARKLGAS